MFVTSITDPKLKANTKYKRVRTLVKNCVEIAQLCDVSINLLVFNKCGQKLQETFTDPGVALTNLVASLLSDQQFMKDIENRERNDDEKSSDLQLFKLESRDALSIYES